MKKQNCWQFALIVIVIFLTLYNIFPTILFYTKPLKCPVQKKQGEAIARKALIRVNNLESEAIKWLKSYNKLLGIKASSIALDPDNPQLIHLYYHSIEDAETLRKYLPKAGALIPFVPSQLAVMQEQKGQDSRVVTLQRKIPIHFDLDHLDSYFSFTFKRQKDGKVAPLYRKIINDRLMQIGLVVGGISDNAQHLEMLIHDKTHPRFEELIHMLSQNILTYTKVFGEHSSVAKRYYASFTQGLMENKTNMIVQLIHIFTQYRDRIKLERIALQEGKVDKRVGEDFFELQKQQQLHLLQLKEEEIASTIDILNRQSFVFSSGDAPWTYVQLEQNIDLSNESEHGVQSIQVGRLSPLINAIQIDWNNDRIDLILHADIESYRRDFEQSRSSLNESLNQLIWNEIARINRETGENFLPYLSDFSLNLNALTNSQSLLVFDLRSVAAEQVEQLAHLIKTEWNPTHPDLKPSAFPIYDYKAFTDLADLKKKIGLVIYAPAQFEMQPLAGFNTHSIYVVARGILSLIHI